MIFNCNFLKKQLSISRSRPAAQRTQCATLDVYAGKLNILQDLLPMILPVSNNDDEQRNGARISPIQASDDKPSCEA